MTREQFLTLCDNLYENAEGVNLSKEEAIDFYKWYAKEEVEHIDEWTAGETADTIKETLEGIEALVSSEIYKDCEMVNIHECAMAGDNLNMKPIK